MLVKTRAVVLHALKYGDRKLIADLLTEELGRLSVVVPMPQGKRPGQKKQLFQPLTLLDLEIDFRQRASLQRLRHAGIARPYVSIPFHPAKLALALFVAEFLLHATRGEQADRQLFAYVCHSLVWLDTASKGFANFHLVLMLRLTRFVGFYPNLERPAESALFAGEAGDMGEADGPFSFFFDLRNGCFAEVAPVHGDFLFPAEAGKISLLMRLHYQNMHLFRLSRAERNRCVEVILAYYRLHVPDFPELKSLAVLRELF